MKMSVMSWSKISCRTLAIILSLVGFCAAVAAQKNDEDIIRVQTDLVTVEVTATNKHGELVRGLTRDDFRLFEGDRERPIDFFESVRKVEDKRPLAIVFALDISGSMTVEELEKLRLAMRSLTERLAGSDSVFAVNSFGMQVKNLQSFTNKPPDLEKAFDKLIKDPNGLSTHAYDAIDYSIRQLVKKVPRTRGNKFVKKAVVIVTDGFPVGDTVAPSTVIERAVEADVGIYTVILPSYSRLSPSPKKPLPTPLDISGVAEKTGGRSVYAVGNDFEPVFHALEQEFISSYLIAFYPSEEKRADGKFHRVRIESKRDLTVKQNREGFQFRPLN